jgi:putative tryptophan/tyrosine transport system substrate-binding protein
MKRREFITLLGGAAAARPLAALAQQAALPVVACINSGTADVQATRLAAFRKGMSEAGYVESQNVTVEYHWMNGHYEGLPALLDDLVRRRVAVIATPGSNPAALAAKAATATIPIVFGVAEDPVALAHPGGNATGVNFFAAEIDAKRSGLMHELLPKATHFAVLLNPTNATSAETTANALKGAAPSIGLELFFGNASTPAEIEAAFAAFTRARANALFIAPDGFFGSRGAQFAALTARDRLPASYVSRETVEAGLLMSYGTNFDDMFHQIGIYTGSILKGTKPADLPVLQSTKFEFILNLKTARSLGVDIPPTLLARADEVIE